MLPGAEFFLFFLTFLFLFGCDLTDAEGREDNSCHFDNVSVCHCGKRRFFINVPSCEYVFGMLSRPAIEKYKSDCCCTCISLNDELVVNCRNNASIATHSLSSMYMILYVYPAWVVRLFFRQFII